MDDKWPWWVVALGGGPGIIGAVYGAWIAWTKRRDDRSDRNLTASEKREERLAGENAAIIANLRLENDRCNARLDEVERERDEADQNSRFWHDQAWKLKRQGQQAQQIAESAARIGNFPPPVWPEDFYEDLPNFSALGRATSRQPLKRRSTDALPPE